MEKALGILLYIFWMPLFIWVMFSGIATKDMKPYYDDPPKRRRKAK